MGFVLFDEDCLQSDSLFGAIFGAIFRAFLSDTRFSEALFRARKRRGIYLEWVVIRAVAAVAMSGSPGRRCCETTSAWLACRAVNKLVQNMRVSRNLGSLTAVVVAINSLVCKVPWKMLVMTLPSVSAGLCRC